MGIQQECDVLQSMLRQVIDSLAEAQSRAKSLPDCDTYELKRKISDILEICCEEMSRLKTSQNQIELIQAMIGNQSGGYSEARLPLLPAATLTTNLSSGLSLNSVVTQSFSSNVPSPRFSNQSSTTLNDELRSADELGIRPVKVGEAGFDDIINEGTVKWAVTTELELLVIPKFLDVNNEIYHTVITRGQPVLAAGEAEIVGNNDAYILLTISNHSGHFRPTSESLELGITAFRQQGVDTSNADIEYVE
jgi:hypothetical protein